MPCPAWKTNKISQINHLANKSYHFLFIIYIVKEAKHLSYSLTNTSQQLPCEVETYYYFPVRAKKTMGQRSNLSKITQLISSEAEILTKACSIARVMLLTTICSMAF